MSIPGYLLVHTVSVQPYEGSGAYGDIFGAPYDLPCYVEQERKLVRDSSGEEVTSSTQVYADPGAEIASGSRVTYFGRTSRVIGVAVYDDGGLTGLSHREIDLE